MKKILLATAALCVSICATAIPAKRGLWQTIRLADGTEVKAELRGDEFMSYLQTEDGRKFTLNETTGLYDRADIDLLQKNADAMRALGKSTRRKGPANVTIGGDHQPYVGEKRGLVILVAFQDVPFRDGHDKSLYNRILNEDNFSNDMGFVGSVRDYFRDQSYGKFLLSFDVVGPITMPKTQAYYGGNDASARNPKSKGIGEMCETALNEADKVVDFSKYDWDGDGEVDQVFFLYAGRGEASGGGANTIWPHEWTLGGALGYTLNLDGKIVNTYACGCEMATNTRIDGIGTICHEFSHCLGLPDMYDTANDSGNYGMCTWDIMDQGNYNGDSFIPSAYTGWERVYAGWKEPIELTETTSVTGMKAIEENGNVYIVRNDAHPDEYYILENRGRKGWDSAQEGEGLLVVHVDFIPQIWASNGVNSSSSDRQHCFPIAADNSYSYASIAGDVFPYNNVNSLTNESTPAATVFYKNTNGTFFMNKPITNITRNADGTISFDFSITEDRSILYESFDQCDGKGGNDGVFNTLGANKNVGQGVVKTDLEGWTYTTAGGANKCVLFTGAATTPEFNINGEATLTFRAGPLSGGTNSTQLTLSAEGNVTLDKTNLTMKAGKMSDFSVKISGNGPAKVTFTPGNRFFLDEIKVESSETTGIDNIAVSDRPSNSKRINNRVYTIDGRYVGTDMRGLKNGIYIVNGKKYVK